MAWATGHMGTGHKQQRGDEGLAGAMMGERGERGETGKKTESGMRVREKRKRLRERFR